MQVQFDKLQYYRQVTNTSAKETHLLQSITQILNQIITQGQ